MDRIDVNAKQINDNCQYNIKEDLNTETEGIRQYTTQRVEIRMTAHNTTYQYHHT
jgi:hypothetical protein